MRIYLNCQTIKSNINNKSIKILHTKWLRKLIISLSILKKSLQNYELLLQKNIV